MGVYAFDELDSAAPESPCFLCCDFCFESSCADCCGDEVRPFYQAVDAGLPYVVCVECLHHFMEGD